MKKYFSFVYLSVFVCFALGGCQPKYEYKPISGLAHATISDGKVYGNYIQHGIHSLFIDDVQNSVIGSIEIIGINEGRTGYIGKEPNKTYKINPGKNKISVVLQAGDIGGLSEIEFKALPGNNYFLDAKGEVENGSLIAPKSGKLLLYVKDDRNNIISTKQFIVQNLFR